MSASARRPRIFACSSRHILLPPLLLEAQCRFRRYVSKAHQRPQLICRKDLGLVAPRHQNTPGPATEKCKAVGQEINDIPPVALRYLEDAMRLLRCVGLVSLDMPVAQVVTCSRIQRYCLRTWSLRKHVARAKRKPLVKRSVRPATAHAAVTRRKQHPRTCKRQFNLDAKASVSQKSIFFVSLDPLDDLPAIANGRTPPLINRNISFKYNCFCLFVYSCFRTQQLFHLHRLREGDQREGDGA